MIRRRPKNQPSQAMLDYLNEVITSAAVDLRNGKPPELVASDLEDAQSWTFDPMTCPHPFQACLPDGREVCRTCRADTTDTEGMGH